MVSDQDIAQVRSALLVLRGVMGELSPVGAATLRCIEEVERLRRIAEAAQKVHFWNDSREPTADLAFDEAMGELGKALEGVT